MKWKIIKHNEKYRLQYKDIFTLFFWKTWRRFGGSFGDEAIEYDTINDAVSALIKINKKDEDLFVISLEDIRKHKQAEINRLRMNWNNGECNSFVYNNDEPKRGYVPSVKFWDDLLKLAKKQIK